MKVLLVTGIYPPDVGGPATFIPRLADWLHRKGHQVTVLCLAAETHQPFKEPWTVVRIQRNQILLIRMLTVIGQIRLLSREVDAIYANGLFEEVGLSGVCRRVRSVAKVVGDPVWERARNRKKTDLEIDEYNSMQLPLRERIERALLRFSLSKFSLVVTPSPSLARTVNTWGISSSVISNGVRAPESLEHPTQTIETFDLVSVSRLVSWKRLDLLIRIAAQARLSLLVVGDGPERESLSTLASALGNNVHFAGQIPSDDVPRQLLRGRVFAQLSSYEGLSFSLLQAMSMGLPCAVSPIESHTYALADSGVYLDPTNIDESAKVLRELCDVPEQLRHYGAMSRMRFTMLFEEDICLEATEKAILGD